jgi:hypothetical protein
MSLRNVEEFTSSLPYSLREQILGYARSVQDAVPEILAEAQVAQSVDVAGQLVFMAGVRKFYSICEANFWILHNSTQILSQYDQNDVRVGRTDYSREGDLYHALSVALNELHSTLLEHGISETMLRRSYVDLASELASER